MAHAKSLSKPALKYINRVLLGIPCWHTVLNPIPTSRVSGTLLVTYKSGRSPGIGFTWIGPPFHLLHAFKPCKFPLHEDFF